MGLIDIGNLLTNKESEKKDDPTMKGYPSLVEQAENTLIIGKPYEQLREHIGVIEQNSNINFWTFGRYTMSHVLKYILKQIGPADVTACTWAIAKFAVEDLLMLTRKGYMKSFKLWIDPRVKVRNPEPMQMLKLNYPIAIAPVHAKVTCISNDDWKISVYGSINFTTAPQPERGCICTVPAIYERDLEILNAVEYERYTIGVK